MIDILQRKKDQRGETMKNGAGAMNACEVRKARDLDPTPHPLSLSPYSKQHNNVHTWLCLLIFSTKQEQFNGQQL